MGVRLCLEPCDHESGRSRGDQGHGDAHGEDLDEVVERHVVMEAGKDHAGTPRATGAPGALGSITFLDVT